MHDLQCLFSTFGKYSSRMKPNCSSASEVYDSTQYSSSMKPSCSSAVEVHDSTQQGVLALAGGPLAVWISMMGFVVTMG